MSDMRLLLCLAATAAICQAARIPRGIGVDPFPNFHSVHHGHGATSYQNVQIENHGSVPVPAGDHDHEFERQHHVVHVHKEPHYAHHDEHEVASVAVIPEDNHQDLQQFIIVEKDFHEVPSVTAVPVDDSHESLQQYNALEPDHHEVSSADGIHENVQYITLKQVPYADTEIQHIELPTASHLHYYGNNYEHEYH